MGLFRKKESTNHDFIATKKIGSYMSIDENNKLLKVSSDFSLKPNIQFNFSDIISFEIIEDNTTLAKSGLGRAVAGGILFGGIGAVVGGVTGRKKKEIISKLAVKITINDMKKPIVYVTLISNKTKTSGIIYKTAINSAQEIAATLELIIFDNEKNRGSL